MRRIGVALLVLSAAGVAIGQDHEGHSARKAIAKEKAELPKCPVMDEPVDFTVSTETDEGPVYFCCKMCVRKFERKPERYADGVKEQRAALAKRDKVQVTCPLSGEPINKKVYTEHEGEKVYFCCNMCKGKYEKDPEKYAGKLRGSYTYQTRCPVMGGKINPTSSLELANGETVYFCCNGCDSKLLAKPEKYAPKLAKQGYVIDVEVIEKTAKAKKDG